MTDKHIPVLAEEVIAYLNPHAGERYLDLTAGYGGHARRVLERLGDNGSAVLVDRDQNAIDHLTRLFAKDLRVEIQHNDFYTASQQLYETGERFDLILADIGLSSPHLDNAQRGFSLQNDGPLDMRMDPRSALTAAEIVNTYCKEHLVSILQKYGEVRGANRIVDAIIEARPIASTTELVGIINASTPRFPKVRLGPQVFQALRIAVNAELDQLSNSLPLWHKLLKPDGRLAVISFHSLEDRIVKRYFSEHAGNRYDAELNLLTKQPITSTPSESSSNPRARSAKLRASQRK